MKADMARQTGEPLLHDAHRLLSAGMEDRTKNNVVGSGKQPISPDRIAQIHRTTSRDDRQARCDRPSEPPKASPRRPAFIPLPRSTKALRPRDPIARRPI